MSTMRPLAYVTDQRGRAGRYCVSGEVAAELPAPAAPLPGSPFEAQERPDGLHIVDTRTGHSFGIMATPAIAETQLKALRRISL